MYTHTHTQSKACSHSPFFLSHTHRHTLMVTTPLFSKTHIFVFSLRYPPLALSQPDPLLLGPPCGRLWLWPDKGFPCQARGLIALRMSAIFLTLSVAIHSQNTTPTQENYTLQTFHKFKFKLEMGGNHHFISNTSKQRGYVEVQLGSMLSVRLCSVFPWTA